MRRHKEMCKLLLEGDSYFNGKDVNTTKINNHSTIKGYCRKGGCKTNEDRINALGAYIFKEFKKLILRKSQYNNYDEYLLMWISDKLLNMHKEGKGKKIKQGYMDAFTLNKTYEEYLENHKANLDYWTLFDINQGLKEANLWYMAEFYKLFNKICKIITEYNDKGAKSKKLSKYSVDCRRQYRTIYMNIYECKSYLDLLNKLKGIYDDFRNSAIKNNSSNNNLATNLIKLTLGNGKEMAAVKGFKRYDFSASQCKFPKKKTPSSKKAKPPGPQASSSENQGNMEGTIQSVQKNGSDISKGTDAGTGDPGSVSGGGQDSKVGDSSSEAGGTSGEPENSDDSKNINQNPPTNELEKQPLLSETKESSPPGISQKTQLQIQSDPVQPEPQNDHESKKTQKEGSNHPDGQGVSKSETKDSGSPTGGGNQLNPTPKDPLTTTPTDTSKGPPSNSLPTSPPNPIQQKQSSSQPQHITHQHPQVPAQVKQTNHQKIGQFVKSLSSDLILKKPWNVFPTTWNGSGDCKPEIKFMNTTLVCCTSEQCSLTGIAVTIVLIPIILSIAYKYLSFGSSKKSEKKNMKRVINFHDGKSKTKIIISSNDRNKDLKLVINSVGGKKDSLLNIYKIIQADPIPFINLFFLLIFFVYKRKRDTIE